MRIKCEYVHHSSPTYTCRGIEFIAKSLIIYKDQEFFETKPNDLKLSLYGKVLFLKVDGVTLQGVPVIQGVELSSNDS